MALLSGGVGGARLARGFEHLESVDTTVVVNVGDDDIFYSWAVSPDLDTVCYTLADLEGPEGWGRKDDTWHLMDDLAKLGTDTSFRIGDRDAAVNLHRTVQLAQGQPLHSITSHIARTMGIRSRILPATNQRLRTEVLVDGGGWASFQEYFVLRGHRDRVTDVRFSGAGEARPSPGVLAAIASADAVIIAPSNPPLSIWPILAIEDIAGAVAAAERVLAVSPLFGGRALKGPAARVLASLGLPPGNRGVVRAYSDLLTDFVIDRQDRKEREALAKMGPTIHALPTRIARREDAMELAQQIMRILALT